MDLKGIAEPVWAWRALGTQSTGGERPVRALEAPLVGREAELDLLQNTYDRALRDQRAHLFTIYGEAGVGKSRLAREFTGSIEGATVLPGRSLPYGEGVTYWPLAEMVKCAAGIADDDPLDVAIDKLRAFCEDEAVADLLGLASGVLEAVQSEASAQEIAWAAREWGQRLAQEQPLVLVFEDIHWAEEPLLELIEHLATWVREAPLLLICLARPELLDFRPGWGGGRVRATAIELEPLLRDESEQLVEALLDGTELTERARRELLDKTEGNPLYRRGDDADGRRGGSRVGRPDPGHPAGADRRAHRPPAAGGEGSAAAGGRDRPHLLVRGDRAPLGGFGLRRGGDRRPPSPRLRQSGGALVDSRASRRIGSSTS